MTTYIVNLSGGLSSAVCLLRLYETVAATDIYAVFADTRIEDPTTYPFLDQLEAVTGIPIHRITDGRTPLDIFQEQGVFTLQSYAPCSKILKKAVIEKHLLEVFGPKETRDLTHVFGIAWDEAHRAERLEKVYAPEKTRFPLMKAPYLWHADMVKVLEEKGLTIPRLYTLGFAHNNCGGGCVRAGQAPSALVYTKLPEVYDRWLAMEEAVRASTGKDIAMMKRIVNGKAIPLPLSMLKNEQERARCSATNDYGACGCFSQASLWEE